MIVCHCLAQSDRQITDAVAAGASTLEEVVACTGAGSACGGCLPLVAHLAEKERRLRGEARTSKAGASAAAHPGACRGVRTGSDAGQCTGATAGKSANTDTVAEPIDAAAAERRT